MTTSPTHSSYSEPPFTSAPSSSASAVPDFSGLPVAAMREKIVSKVLENRVTLIVGETGCGKSSQVPQFLLEANMEPILCTQPRRFAVVAVARMVAKARSCEVGGEVGYHIGHSRVFSARSKIMFKTAGVLLDEMRDKGLNALKYKVIILDEVHERSVESDLVLVCVKQLLLKKKDFRLVLMSATADISRYREYFRDLGRGERVEVLAIPSTGKHTIYERKVSYLEQVMELLGIDSDQPSLRYCSGPNPALADAGFKPEVHQLMHDLILHIHKNEPDIEKGILVFLPTYYALEKQWSLLKPFSQSFKVHILHSSVDTEQALRAMRIWRSHRKVILATNIAESSVTIPKVGYVIDSCRSLQVFWDNNRKTDSPELVWVSKSQAEQRRGRTGRTCHGRVYRLVTSSFFGQLEDYEAPALLRLSLRQQVLLLCCTESKAINDPKALLQKAMDPPDPDVVDDALNLLVRIHALEKSSSRLRYEPTFYGRLLASFSLSFNASVLILKFAEIGRLREGILFGILMDLQPLPIIRPFAQEILHVQYQDNYYGVSSKSSGLGSKETTFMANLHAYQFWQRVFMDKARLERLKNVIGFHETEGTQNLLQKNEEEWCSFHYLVQPALHQIAESYDEILNTLHRFRPQFLVTSESLPSYYKPYEFQHICDLDSEQMGDTGELAPEDDHLQVRRCFAGPFVRSTDFESDQVASTVASVVKEIRIQHAEDESRVPQGFHNGGGYMLDGGLPICTFFAKGLCNRGNLCPFSHSLQAKRPACKFFFSLQGCRNGESCFFSHDSDTLSISGNEPHMCCPEEDYTDAVSLVRLFPDSDGRILVVDDTDLRFSSRIAYHYESTSIIATCAQDSFTLDPASEGIKIFTGLSHPYQTIMGKAGRKPVPWKEVKCILWFPSFGHHEEREGQKRQVKSFFEYLAIRLLGDDLKDVQVILTINNLRFSQLEVEALARDCFFFLEESFPFDEISFGEFFDEMNSKKPMFVAKPISYVFVLHLPAGRDTKMCKMLFREHLHHLS